MAQPRFIPESCQFSLKLIHMNQKYVFLFSSLLESIKSFGSGVLNRVGRVTLTGTKHNFFLALDCSITLGLPVVKDCQLSKLLKTKPKIKSIYSSMSQESFCHF